MATTTRKTSCPVTRTQFTSKAKDLPVSISGQPIQAVVKQFSTQSFGWYANGKVTITVDGVPCLCQVGLNITVIGSKDLPGALGSEESIQAALSTPEVQAIVQAAKAKDQAA